MFLDWTTIVKVSQKNNWNESKIWCISCKLKSIENLKIAFLSFKNWLDPPKSVKNQLLAWFLVDLTPYMCIQTKKGITGKIWHTSCKLKSIEYL